MNTFDWRLIAAVLVGGGIGSVARYVVTFGMTQRFGPGYAWLPTLTINIAGSFIIGIVFQLAQTRAFGITSVVRVLLMTGVIGGFTTFSTFSLDMVTLAGEGAPLLALAYGAGSVVAGFFGAYAGIVAVRSLQP